ncbi:MAG TPA: 1-deoxy-D-xylulose-5-phosphate reductoisomerase, partial [Planctomycetota bacterium]|nr:1-deoxy-D-xylulose-5-phosphate reductoisomerase [Planctomycetota bacterium]
MSDHRARALCLLGATGSIGVSTLSVAAHLGIPVHAVSAHSKVDLLATQARACGAKVAVIGEPARFDELKRALSGSGIRAAAEATA